MVLGARHFQERSTIGVGPRFLAHALIVLWVQLLPASDVRQLAEHERNQVTRKVLEPGAEPGPQALPAKRCVRRKRRWLIDVQAAELRIAAALQAHMLARGVIQL